MNTHEKTTTSQRLKIKHALQTSTCIEHWSTDCEAAVTLISLVAIADHIERGIWFAIELIID